MRETFFRSLTELEQEIFESLFSVDFPGRAQLLQQLKNVLVREIDDAGSLELQVQNPVLAPVIRRIPIEARYSDGDPSSPPETGPYVNVLLHVVHGLMNELEIYKDDGSPIKTQPKSSRLEIMLH